MKTLNKLEMQGHFLNSITASMQNPQLPRHSMVKDWIPFPKDQEQDKDVCLCDDYSTLSQRFQPGKLGKKKK